MSEEVLRVLLSDLVKTRVQCKKCKAVIEVNTADLFVTFERQQCPCCQSLFYDRDKARAQGVANPFEKLSDALTIFGELTDKLEVEFTVRQPVAGK